MSGPVDRADVERLQAIIARRIGLNHDEAKLDFLGEVLRRRMASTRCARFDAYVALLDGPDELPALIEELTVPETYFFRNEAHFAALTEVVLPERIRARSAEKRLRILSAGCASGEEPYSLAVAVRETLPDHASWDLQILGVDINRAVLAKAARARYSPWSLRATSDEARRRWFHADGNEAVLDPSVRRMVTFQRHSLTDDDAPFWRPESQDVVFCRNVIMYFVPEVMAEVVERLARALAPGGYLFLGHAETLRGLSQDFHLCHTHDTFYYQRRETTAPRRGTRPPPPADPFEATLPGMVDATGSWVEVIRQATMRIAALEQERSRRPSEPGPAGPGAVAPVTRSWDLGLVLEAMRRERFEDALGLLGALPAAAQTEPDILLVRAALLTNAGRLAEAEEVCGRILELDELNAGARYLMALCREHAGDAAGAIEHDRTAIYLDDAFAMPHLHLGLMARRAGDREGARRELEHALVLLAREEASRLLLFAGGFSRDTLLQLCRTELRAVGGEG